MHLDALWRLVWLCPNRSRMWQCVQLFLCNTSPNNSLRCLWLSVCLILLLPLFWLVTVKYERIVYSLLFIFTPSLIIYPVCLSRVCLSYLSMFGVVLGTIFFVWFSMLICVWNCVLISSILLFSFSKFSEDSVYIFTFHLTYMVLQFYCDVDDCIKAIPKDCQERIKNNSTTTTRG